VIIVRCLASKRFTSKALIPNLYGPQRFSKNNDEIGEALIKRNFKKAIELIDQPEVKERLNDYPGDFIGALRQLPLKTRKIYIHAYQSLLWNRTAKEYTKLSHKNIEIPLIGFGTDIESIQDEDLKSIIQEIIKQEEITTRDFILPAIKELSSEGSQRKLFMKIKNLEIQITADELNENKFKAIVSFSLQKGSYATVVIQELFQ
jgi:tRNA(Glu) U13 pseudouridine synthase TruD